MPNNKEVLNWHQIFTPKPEQRKNWYGDIAQTYDRVRPKYNQAFLERVIQVAEISPSGRILEIGCGPGTATISLAKMGFSVVAIEPSLAACNLARQNLAEYPDVEIINNNFEEWQPEDRKFDAIIAATSWHWVAPESKYQKAASLLKNSNALILLWNTGMKPPLEIFESLADIFAQDLPAFAKYKDCETELVEMRSFANEAIDSGLFSNLCEDYQVNQVNYAINDYLQLLTTYSPWIALSPECRSDLLERLRELLVQNCGEQIPLVYLSAFHVISKFML